MLTDGEVAVLSEDDALQLLVAAAPVDQRAAATEALRRHAESGTSAIRNVSGEAGVDRILSRYLEAVRARIADSRHTARVLVARAPAQMLASNSALYVRAEGETGRPVLVVAADCTPQQLRAALKVISSGAFAARETSAAKSTAKVLLPDLVSKRHPEREHSDHSRYAAILGALDVATNSVQTELGMLRYTSTSLE
jgi:hypothetical protein